MTYFHRTIMNLQPRFANIDYLNGHRDARLAAADVALDADACLAALQELAAELRTCEDDFVRTTWVGSIVRQALDRFGK